MKIGRHQLKNNLILAPMAGFSCPALRRLCAEIGVGLTVTEMISVKGLLYGNEKTNDLLKTSEAEGIKCVQLFGREPKDFALAAKLPQLEKFDIIDINMGCPVKKIAGAGEGSALIREHNRAADIVYAVKATGRTVTVKTRLMEEGDRGDDPASFIKALKSAGADMIAVHARTASQMYRGTADYAAFSALKKELSSSAPSVPLALSGDIVDYASYQRARDCGADLFMIGRGAVANPSIFAEILRDDKTAPLAEKKTVVLRLLDYMEEDMGEDTAVRAFRKFLPYVLKGERCSKEQKHRMNFIEDMATLKSTLLGIL